MARRCVKCKATEFEETEEGMLMCIECGTQVRGVVEETLDFGDAGGFSGRRIKSSKRVVEEAEHVTEWPTPALVFEAFQHVLQTFVAAVVRLHPSCSKSLPPAVGELWFRTLQLFPEAKQVARLPHNRRACKRPPRWRARCLCVRLSTAHAPALACHVPV